MTCSRRSRVHRCELHSCNSVLQQAKLPFVCARACVSTIVCVCVCVTPVFRTSGMNACAMNNHLLTRYFSRRFGNLHDDDDDDGDTYTCGCCELLSEFSSSNILLLRTIPTPSHTHTPSILKKKKRLFIATFALSLTFTR